MTQAIGKYAAKRFLKDRVAKESDVSDSDFFRHKKVRALDGVSPEDLKVLNRVKRNARWLDNGLCNCCGIRVGWSAVFGLIPVVGDFMDMILALWIVQSCAKIQGGLPKELRAKMMSNVVIDFCIGLIPFLGDIADALYRCNTKNAKLLYGYLKVEGQANLAEKPPGYRAHPNSDPMRQHQMDTV